MRTTNGTARALFFRKDRRYLRTADKQIEGLQAAGLNGEADRVRQKRAKICMAQMLGTHWHGNSELQEQASMPAMEQALK